MLGNTFWKQPSPNIVNSHTVNQFRAFASITAFNIERAFALFCPFFDEKEKFLVSVQ